VSVRALDQVNGRGVRAARASLVPLAVVAALPALAALAALLGAWREPDAALWAHLGSHLLGEAIQTTVLVAVATGIVAAVVGSGFGALVALAEFRGRRLLEILLVLPLAIPAYVVAFTWVSVVDVGSPLRAYAIEVVGHARWLPSMRNPAGAVFVLSLSLYPYVYLLVRAVLRARGSVLFDVARSLGATPFVAWQRVLLPLAWPAVLAGTVLVALEVFAEFGAMSVLGVDTLSVLVYRTWFGLGSLAGAAQLASLLLLLALLVVGADSWLGRRVPPSPPPSGAGTVRQLGPLVTLLVWVFALIWLLPALGLPISRLLGWAFQDVSAWGRVVEPALNTLVFAGGAALLIVAGGLAVAGFQRAGVESRWRRLLVTSAGLGYAIPGVVLAAGLMLLLVALERALGTSGLLSASTFAVWLGLVARFLRVGIDGGATALAQVPANLDAAARLLGAGRLRRLRAVHWPALRPLLGATWLLALVECAKEMPATLMLRPFGGDTLAVKVHNATSEGLWAEAAVPALVIVLVAMLPVTLLLAGSGRASSEPVPAIRRRYPRPEAHPQP
jgi:iron(III) transport system permease protein